MRFAPTVKSVLLNELLHDYCYDDEKKNMIVDDDYDYEDDN